MAEVKQVRHKTDDDVVVRAKDFWTKYGRGILVASAAIILIGGGWLAYKYFIKAPKEKKAQEAIWKTQGNYDKDSMRLTLSGDRGAAGAEKLAKDYGGTKAGELANYYAG